MKNKWRRFRYNYHLYCHYGLELKDSVFVFCRCGKYLGVVDELS